MRRNTRGSVVETARRDETSDAGRCPEVTKGSVRALAIALVVGGCSESHRPPRPVATTAELPAATTASPGAATPDAATPDASTIADEELGPLVDRLSEAPGDFPSDNFVSNETSYLDVAPALRAPALRGRAYVGVGPEQNLTYVALLEPAIAYVVDLRRGNLLEHLVLRGCFEAGETRAAFLTALLARRPRAPLPEDASGFGPLAAAFASAPPERALRDEGVARTRSLLDRLHLTRATHDDERIARIHDAFFARGLALAFTMRNGGAWYPSLGAMLAARDPAGEEASFLASEDGYRRVRRLVLANRVVPVVGDFGGRHALAAVAADMRARGLQLGAFYTSNVEQYLFDAHTHGAFVDNVAAMPLDDASLIVRVWFDQGRRHPRQAPGRRTTSLTMPAAAFVERARAHPYTSYWEVVTSD
jgi:hypothetical protein